jgi:hypothetical protein
VTDFIDRTERKPKQGVDVNVRRTTNFRPAPAESATPPSEASGEAAPDGTTPGPNGEPMFQL